MKKITVVFLFLCVAIFFGCEKKDSSKPEYKIGIIQLAEHEALDAAYRGFVDGLAQQGFVDGQNIKLDFNNAQSDLSNCVTIAQKLVNTKSDLILAISTPAAQTVANLTKTIPVVVTAVTDPVSAKLVSSNQNPAGNITGTSDLTPIKAQVELIKTLVPDVKTIGLLYSSSEPNSKYQIEIAKDTCKKIGVDYIEATVTSINDIQQVAQSLIGKVDAIYVPTDNTVVSAIANVAIVTNEVKLPIICGDEGSVQHGALATYSINYYELGKQTSRQAVEILRDGKNPATMPIEYQENYDFIVNMETAEFLDIKIPNELLPIEK
ncbi:MAG: ABC transporter substrate-binding protein [Spirochaetaceae bacterium]|nr:ABC transporter substrate-binding protein [Spirochaetaceae bacterium]